jgi:signal transduction histidine kinase
MPSAVGKVATELRIAYATALRLKRVVLRLEIAPELITEIDEGELRAVLSSLLAAALLATPAGGWIRIAAQPQRGEALIAVKDSGDGLPRALGSLVHTLRSRGGRLWSDSKVGCGSTYYVALPRTLRPAKRRTPVPA